MLVSRANIYSFAFQNLSQKVQSKLDQTIVKYVVSPSNMQKYLDELVSIQPHYILGLGEYSGRDQDQLRIETIARNKFRNEPITIDRAMTEQQHFTAFLHPGKKMTVAKAMGNSWCNLVSWKIVELIRRRQLTSKYTFLHIPKKFPVSEAAEVINEALQKLKVES